MKNLILKDLLPDWLHEFADQAVNGEISFKDEYELQETLICSLRKMLSSVKLDSIFTVEKEVKIDFAFNDPNFKTQCGKETIDVVIFKGLCIKKTEEKYAIELKYPHREAYPFMMYSCVKDIAFMEEAQDLWNTGVVNPFDGSYCLTFVDNKNFYTATPFQEPGSIYSHFRPVEGKIAPIQGTIVSGTQPSLNISGSYMINWLPCGKYHYYLVVI